MTRAPLDELSERVLSFIAEIPSTFATVRRRVARHLLDFASEGQRGSELVTAIGRQQLADAVGTVREVVVRALRELREEGLLRTERARIVILGRLPACPRRGSSRLLKRLFAASRPTPCSPPRAYVGKRRRPWISAWLRIVASSSSRATTTTLFQTPR